GARSGGGRAGTPAPPRRAVPSARTAVVHPVSSGPLASAGGRPRYRFPSPLVVTHAPMGVDDARQRPRAGEARRHRIDAVLWTGEAGEPSAAGAVPGLVDLHVLLETLPQPLVGLAVTVERPHQHRRPERKGV